MFQMIVNFIDKLALKIITVRQSIYLPNPSAMGRVLVGWLVSLFNGILTFVGYLMPKSFS